ncbi:MAG TPA: hypothetical protein PKD17_07670 [Cellvibrionaceae bacterium]|nr:hypothetical protein [Cellvibrionaceae bacterium]HMY38710.1 hypothetical protein [Marinagarivorans sp.]HNG61913.1 hypothetical protein [Cellvibrionaceae bacterium]
MQIGPGLNTLTQIQGAWRNSCHRVGIKESEGYRQDFLNINFTHFEFTAKVYKDTSCTHLVTQWPARYRFIVGDQVLLPNHEKAFLLSLNEEADPADAWALSPLNILQYKAGQLSLGRESLLGPSTTQLTSLDLDLSFSRR